MSAFCQRAQYRTLEEYLRENSPRKLEDIRYGCSTPDALEREFWPVRLWLAYEEARFGLPPVFDDQGERLWHPMLLEWWDDDKCLLPGWFYDVPDHILQTLGVVPWTRARGRPLALQWHKALPRILPPVPCFPPSAPASSDAVLTAESVSRSQ